MGQAGACLSLLVAAGLSGGCSKNAVPAAAAGNPVAIRITVAEKDFTAILAATPAAVEFAKQLPLTLRMNELNGNEKYAGLPEKLPAASACPGRINRGDLMLYGSSTLVLFYESFPTSYSYTAIGRIADADTLKAALGRGNVTVTFAQKQKQR